MDYFEWLHERTEINPDVMGGARVIRGTRLTVSRIGMCPPECEEELAEDYPYLMAFDLPHARTYLQREARLVDIHEAMNFVWQRFNRTLERGTEPQGSQRPPYGEPEGPTPGEG